VRDPAATRYRALGEEFGLIVAEKVAAAWQERKTNYE
jgi:hypothetical protein